MTGLPWKQEALRCPMFVRAWGSLVSARPFRRAGAQEGVQAVSSHVQVHNLLSVLLRWLEPQDSVKWRQAGIFTVFPTSVGMLPSASLALSKQKAWHFPSGVSVYLPLLPVLQGETCRVVDICLPYLNFS